MAYERVEGLEPFPVAVVVFGTAVARVATPPGFGTVEEVVDLVEGPPGRVELPEG